MPKIKIKPLSVNECWQGRRFKTQKYKDYEKELLFLLPKGIGIGSEFGYYDEDALKRLRDKNNSIDLKLEIGLSSKMADIDNILKPLLDILQKKYQFNDKNIYKMEIEKKIVKKGEEYIDFYFSVSVND